MEAAERDFHQFAKVLKNHLEDRDWLVGDGMTTADISVASILCYRAHCNYPIEGYDNINRWIAVIEAMPSWQAVDQMAQAA